MKKLPLCGVFVLLSCTSNLAEEQHAVSVVRSLLPPSKVRIEQICRTYADNDFIGYVECMYSCRNKPTSYLLQMQNILKQRFASLAKDSVEIDGVRTEQILLNERSNAADVYLDITYSDGRQEEILLPMVYDDGKWWVK